MTEITKLHPVEDDSITCGDCNGACCSDVIFALNEQEAASLRSAGSNIKEILGFLTTLSFLPDEFGDIRATPLSWADHVDALEEFAATKEDTLGKANWQRIIRFAKGMKIGEALFVMDGACGFLQDDGTCGNYKDRPLVCRDFPVGGSACQAMRSKQETAVAVEITAKPV